MSKPVGIVTKTKDNSRKKFREHEEFNKGKKLGRPKQVFDPETKTWRKL
jgi:hypothetical protein